MIIISSYIIEIALIEIDKRLPIEIDVCDVKFNDVC